MWTACPDGGHDQGARRWSRRQSKTKVHPAHCLVVWAMPSHSRGSGSPATRPGPPVLNPICELATRPKEPFHEMTHRLIPKTRRRSVSVLDLLKQMQHVLPFLNPWPGRTVSNLGRYGIGQSDAISHLSMSAGVTSRAATPGAPLACRYVLPGREGNRQPSGQDNERHHDHGRCAAAADNGQRSSAAHRTSAVGMQAPSANSRWI